MKWEEYASEMQRINPANVEFAELYAKTEEELKEKVKEYCEEKGLDEKFLDEKAIEEGYKVADRFNVYFTDEGYYDIWALGYL